MNYCSAERRIEKRLSSVRNTDHAIDVLKFTYTILLNALSSSHKPYCPVLNELKSVKSRFMLVHVIFFLYNPECKKGK